jgi:hypothetical protein
VNGPERAQPRLDVYCIEDGSWLWSYRTGDTELISNHTFANRSDALASARRAYPDLPSAQIHVGSAPRAPADREHPGPLAFVLGLTAIVLAWRNRRAARRVR